MRARWAPAGDIGRASGEPGTKEHWPLSPSVGRRTARNAHSLGCDLSPGVLDIDMARPGLLNSEARHQQKAAGILNISCEIWKVTWGFSLFSASPLRLGWKSSPIRYNRNFTQRSEVEISQKGSISCPKNQLEIPLVTIKLKNQQMAIACIVQSITGSLPEFSILTYTEEACSLVNSAGIVLVLPGEHDWT